MPSVLHIKLLGNLDLEYGGVPVTGIDTPRLQSLLAYLVLHSHAPQQRQYLAFCFWPDSTEKQARTNLRQLLHHLRQALPDADRFIEAGTHTLQWRPDSPFTLDVTAFRDALAQAVQAAPNATQAILEKAVGLYRNDLLLSCYDEWIEPERERLRQSYMAALVRLVRLLEQQRAYLEAARYASRLLQKDSLRETTYRTLMRLHALRRDRASALRVYHECATVLERELGVEPGPATSDLYERLVNLQTVADDQRTAQPLGQAAELPLVGRLSEWQEMQVAWHKATRERTSVALIAGEAGIGKSRLAEEMLTWAARQGVPTARTRCYAAEGRLAFAPIADWLRADVLQQVLPKLDAVWRTEVARILPELLSKTAALPHPEPLTEGWQRRQFFEALARAVLAVSQPMVLLIDDLQWCDQDTLEWLHYLLRFDEEAPLLLLGTVRIEAVGPAHPLETLLLELRRIGLLTEITLGPLGPTETKALAEHVAAQTLAPDQAALLHQETEGNPLFVVESVRAGRMAATEQPRAEVVALPPKVQALFTARLAQCSSQARALARLAAVVGRAFSFEVLAEASGGDEDTLIRSLDELWQRRIVREYGLHTYDFSHDKLREVAYAEISPVRRPRLHRRVAVALESIHADTLDAVSSQLAVHYERAGMVDQAITFYQRAARVAQRVYANEEAITHLNHALALLGERPDSVQRDARERTMLSQLGLSLLTARGYAAPEVDQVYTRAYALCREDEDPHQLFSVLYGLCAYRVVHAELREAHDLCKRLLRLAQSCKDPMLLVPAHFELGVCLFHLGELAPAHEHLEEALSFYSPAQHTHFRTAFLGADPGVFGLSYRAHVLWHLGYPDQAVECAHDALALAEDRSHPFSRVIALSYLTMLHQFRRECKTVLVYADQAMALSTEHGFPYYEAWGRIMKGWALHQQGHCEAGTSAMHQGLQDIRTIGTGLREPHYLTLMAQACGSEEELGLLTDALKVVNRTGECWQKAEIYRLCGRSLLHRDVAQAEAWLGRALDTARQQRALPLELRAAMCLSRLWQNHRRDENARELLQAVYDRFTQGFDTPDLQEARKLLDDLS